MIQMSRPNLFSEFFVSLIAGIRISISIVNRTLHIRCGFILEYQIITKIYLNIYRYHKEIDNSALKSSVTTSVQWPSIGEFNVQLGEDKLKEYIDFTSDVRNRWTYSLRFFGEKSDTSSSFYIYETLFSIPTHAYPVPQVSVSIYFTIEVSRVIPGCCQVEVTFALENCDLIMMPGIHNITEGMLSRTAQKKLSLFRKMEW